MREICFVKTLGERKWADNDVDVDGDCYQAWKYEFHDFDHGQLS